MHVLKRIRSTQYLQIYHIEHTGWCKATPRPFYTPYRWPGLILSRPVVVKQLPGPSLPKLMEQLNIDLDSGIIRISQFIYRICPGMSQDTLVSRAFAVPVRIREGLAPSEIGTVYTFDLCHVWPGSVTGECSPSRLPSTRTVPELGHFDYRRTLCVSVGSRSACLSGHVFNTRQTGCCKTTPRPFSSHN